MLFFHLNCYMSPACSIPAELNIYKRTFFSVVEKEKNNVSAKLQ